MAKKKLIIILGIILAILILIGIIFLLFNKMELTGNVIYGVCTGTLDCTSEPVEECLPPTCSWDLDLSSCFNLPDANCDEITDEINCGVIGGCSWTPCTDNDGDDYATDGGECGEIDCDDTNPNINLDGTEICNGLDDDCDSEIDEGISCPCGDGYGECRCGDIVSGNVILSNNLECEGAGSTSYALAIGSPDITLDCNGNSILGNYVGIGVKFSGVTGATIQNCYIEGFENGILSGNAVTSGNYIINNTIYDTSQYGIALRRATEYNIINNTVNYSDIGIWISGAGDAAENNILSGNEIYDCYYGFAAGNTDYFKASDGDYHGNTYGVYLQGVGTDSILPLIENSRIYNNGHGIYLDGSSYAEIVDSNFTNNQDGEGPGEPMTGLHVSSDSSVYLTNGNFEANGDYGIYDAGPDSVYWSLTKDVYCTDNNISIANGWMLPMGGSIITDNCSVIINGEEMNLSGGQTGSYKESYTEGNVFGNASYGVEGEIHTGTGAYSGDLIVNFYTENPGGNSFSLPDFGLWVDASLGSTPPGDLLWWMLKLYYTDEDLAASGIAEADLVIQFYNASDDTWTTELDQGVNEDENYVWVNLTHFSIFGLFEGESSAVITTGNRHNTLTNITNETSNVSIEQPENATPEEITACKDIGGKVCLSEETCDGERIFAKEGVCCLGKCEKKKSSLWLIITIIAAVAIVIAISSRMLKHKRKN